MEEIGKFIKQEYTVSKGRNVRKVRKTLKNTKVEFNTKVDIQKNLSHKVRKTPKEYKGRYSQRI